ncbi:unnamed protein product [Peronospora destructor]|uniref:WW domain-containing protein n=1 Tax=Peronospora destructor TaxID=86335 RepID=A0AAV0V4W7_9STRA|nr:unnamed protein product [Peronospora destructor]
MEQTKTLLVDETQEMPLSDFSSPVEAVQDIKTVIVHDASDSEQHQENENTAEEEGIAQVTSDKNTLAAEESEVIAEAREEHEDVVASDDAGDSECNAIEAEETDLVDRDVTVNDTQKAEAAEEDVEKLKDPLIIVTAEGVANLKKESFSMDVAKLTLSIDDDGSAENHTPVAISSLVVDEAMTTLDGTVQFPQEMELASPTAIPDVLAATTDLSTEDTIEPGLLEADANEFGGQVVNEGKSEEDDHATITAVIESAEKSVPVDANLEVVLEKIRTKLSCESVQVLESGEIEVLPKGWSIRQSKSNDGKRYYVSPYGHTQWLRPPMKTGVIYNWVHEIEVTFGPGRLGLNLKQIAGLPGTKFTDLQVHIVEIYKLPNGMASPAEIYNWSVKPEKRLAVNMRITMMNGIPMTGYTYSQVLELLARLVRPVRIKFADITKGIVGRADEELPHEDSEEVKEARAARVMQNLLRMEYFQIVVSSELHKQVWATMKQHIRLKCLEMRKKCEVMEMQVEREQRTEESLEKERENLIREEYSLKDMIEKLDMQMSGEIESPEVLRTAELVQRAVELDNDVTEIITENAELQAARVKTEETLDCLQKELDEYGDLDLGLERSAGH